MRLDYTLTIDYFMDADIELHRDPIKWYELAAFAHRNVYNSIFYFYHYMVKYYIDIKNTKFPNIEKMYNKYIKNENIYGLILFHIIRIKFTDINSVLSIYKKKLDGFTCNFIGEIYRDYLNDRETANKYFITGLNKYYNSLCFCNYGCYMIAKYKETGSTEGDPDKYISRAEHYFSAATKDDFPIAYHNLGQLYELQSNDKKQAIENFYQASIKHFCLSCCHYFRLKFEEADEFAVVEFIEFMEKHNCIKNFMLWYRCLVFAVNNIDKIDDKQIEHIIMRCMYDINNYSSSKQTKNKQKVINVIKSLDAKFIDFVNQLEESL